MNKPLMKSVIARNKDTQQALAQALKLTQSGISNRINGKVDFRLSEIECIRKRYNLTAEEIANIFFTRDVS